MAYFKVELCYVDRKWWNGNELLTKSFISQMINEIMKKWNRVQKNDYFKCHYVKCAKFTPHQLQFDLTWIDELTFHAIS